MRERKRKRVSAKCRDMREERCAARLHATRHEESTCSETLRENKYYIMDIIITTIDDTKYYKIMITNYGDIFFGTVRT